MIVIEEIRKNSNKISQNVRKYSFTCEEKTEIRFLLYNLITTGITFIIFIYVKRNLNIRNS